MLNREYLARTKYDWETDPRKLRVVKDGYPMIEHGRCFHCGRLFLNAGYAIVFCRDCNKAMSCSAEGPDHDYDHFIHPKALNHKTGNIETPTNPQLKRESQEPIPFEMEEGFKRAQQTNSSFKFATGKPVTKGLYDL